MKIIKLIPNFVLLAGGLYVTTALSIPNLNNESDAMQITTHFNNLTGIACDGSGQSCVSVGVIHHANSLDHMVYTTNNGGITWSQGTLLAHPAIEDNIAEPTESSQNFMTIRCNTTGQDCLIAGTASMNNQPVVLTYTSHDAGQSWSLPQQYQTAEQSVVDDYPVLRLKCNANATSCILAINTTLHKQSIPTMLITKNGGETWEPTTSLSMPSSAPNGITVLDLACDQTGLFCTALTSTAESDDAENNNLTPISPTAFIYSTHDGGSTWSDAKPLMLTAPNTQDVLESKADVPQILSCDPSGLSCIALGTLYTTETTENSSTITSNNTHAYITKNGGLSWQDTTEIVATDPKLFNIFSALNCDITNRFCTAVGFATNNDNETDMFTPIIYTTIDSGHTWQKKPFTPSPNILSLMLDVFCSEDAALCHAVGFFLKS